MRFFIFRRKNFADKNSIGLFLNNTASKEEKQDYRFNFKFYKLKVYILLKQALNLFFKGGNQLGVRSPQFSSLDTPPSLGFQRTCALWNPNSFIHFNFLGKLYTIFIKIRKLDTRIIYFL